MFGLAASIFAALLVQGLWRERRWTRPGLLAFATACAAFPVVVMQQMPVRPPLAAFAGLPVGILLIWWYLYRKRTVAAYYESLERAR